MEWQQRSSSEIESEFSGLGEAKDHFSNVVAIYFQDSPDTFPIIVTGNTSCPGCRSTYPFRLEALKDFDASCRVTCTASQCRDEYDVYAAYRPGWTGWGDDPPIYLYARMYSTLKRQPLTPIRLDVEDVTFG